MEGAGRGNRITPGKDEQILSTVGDSVPMVYAAEHTNLCLMGDQSDVDALLSRAWFWLWASLAGLLASLPLSDACALGVGSGKNVIGVPSITGVSTQSIPNTSQQF